MINRASMREYRQKPYWFLRIIGWAILGIAGAAGLALLFGYVVMLLWNWLMPELFGLATIGFWQAFGIVFLARIIFGGGGMKGHGDSSKSEKWKSSRSKKYNKDNCKDWKHYDKFWEEEGAEAYEKYLQKDELDKKAE